MKMDISREALEKLNAAELQKVISEACDIQTHRTLAANAESLNERKALIEKFRSEVDRTELYSEYTFEYSLPVKFTLSVGYAADGSPYVEDFGAKLLASNEFDKKTKAELQSVLNDYGYDACARVFNILPSDQKKDLNSKVKAVKALIKKLSNNGLDLSEF